MPKMDLGVGPEDIADGEPFQDLRRHWVSLRLYAYMTWPHSAERREQYFAWTVTSLIGDGIIPDSVLAKYGGHKTLCSAPALEALRTEAADRARQALIAGELLGLIMAMDKQLPKRRGGASLNKAAIILESLKPFGVADEATFRKRIWPEFRGVAHIAHAQEWAIQRARMVYGDAFSDGRLFVANLSATLGLARRLQRFSIAFTSTGRSEPLIPKDELWLVPEGYGTNDPRLGEPELTPAAKQAADTYQAVRAHLSKEDSKWGRPARPR